VREHLRERTRTDGTEPAMYRPPKVVLASVGRDGAVRPPSTISGTGAQTAHPQLATLRTMAESLASVASSSAVKYHADSISWCGAPSSRVRFASWVKPNVMYFLSARKKQTVLPSFAYPGMPYQTVGS